MNDGLIPKRYAKALYKLAIENGDTEQIYEQLKPLSQGLKGLDDVTKAPLHRFEYLYHAMEMVGHTDAGMYRHAVAMGGLDLRGLVP